MHTKSDNIEIMMGSETDEIIEESFKSLFQRYQDGLEESMKGSEFLKSLFQRYQDGLEESMKGSEFLFDSVHVLYYDLKKIGLNRGGSYIDSPEWLNNKKATTN